MGLQGITYMITTDSQADMILWNCGQRIAGVCLDGLGFTLSKREFGLEDWRIKGLSGESRPLHAYHQSPSSQSPIMITITFDSFSLSLSL